MTHYALDFPGVDFTGTHDSTAGLQAFFDACSTDKRPGVIPPGTYLLSRVPGQNGGAIFVGSDTHVSMWGAIFKPAPFVFLPDTGMRLVFFQIGLRRAERVLLEGGTIDGDWKKVPRAYGTHGMEIGSDQTREIHIHGVRFIQHKTNDGSLGGGTDEGGVGIEVGDGVGPHHLWVSECYAEDCERGGFRFGQSKEALWLDRCYVKNCGLTRDGRNAAQPSIELKCDKPERYHISARITNCCVEGGSRGIYVDGYAGGQPDSGLGSNVIVQGNHVRNVLGPGIVLNITGRVHCTNNIVTGCGHHPDPSALARSMGISVRGAPHLSMTAIIAHNSVVNCGAVGIELDNCRCCSVLENFVALNTLNVYPAYASNGAEVFPPEAIVAPHHDTSVDLVFSNAAQWDGGAITIKGSHPSGAPQTEAALAGTIMALGPGVQTLPLNKVWRARQAINGITAISKKGGLGGGVVSTVTVTTTLNVYPAYASNGAEDFPPEAIVAPDQEASVDLVFSNAAQWDGGDITITGFAPPPCRPWRCPNRKSRCNGHHEPGVWRPDVARARALEGQASHQRDHGHQQGQPRSGGQHGHGHHHAQRISGLCQQRGQRLPPWGHPGPGSGCVRGPGLLGPDPVERRGHHDHGDRSLWR